jgi:riboflavin synthase
MFTGIVEKLAPVSSVKKTGAKTFEVKVDLGRRFGSSVKVGDSVAINGTCLTATAQDGGIVSFDVIEETLRMTCLGRLSTGSKVNIERSLTLSDRLSGHFVSGHVDGTGTILRREPQADGSVKVWIKAPPELLGLMVKKGSVAVDGVSLTLVDVTKSAFSFCLIPHTLACTTLGFKMSGDIVNIETDLLGKFVKRLLTFTSDPSPIDA